jgi:hypothetical protein
VKLKYQAGGLVDVFDIRSELYDVRNMIQGWKNNHLSDGDLQRPHDSLMCRVCQARDGELRGVDHAIRVFGGRPRR